MNTHKNSSYMTSNIEINIQHAIFAGVIRISENKVFLESRDELFAAHARRLQSLFSSVLPLNYGLSRVAFISSDCKTMTFYFLLFNTMTFIIIILSFCLSYPFVQFPRWAPFILKSHGFSRSKLNAL